MESANTAPASQTQKQSQPIVNYKEAQGGIKEIPP